MEIIVSWRKETIEFICDLDTLLSIALWWNGFFHVPNGTARDNSCTKGRTCLYFINVKKGHLFYIRNIKRRNMCPRHSFKSPRTEKHNMQFPRVHDSRKKNCNYHVATVMETNRNKHHRFLDKWLSQTFVQRK